MSGRKKKGVSTLLGGVVSIGLGVVLMATTQTPEWVPVVLSLAGTIANVLGFTIVFPDED